MFKWMSASVLAALVVVGVAAYALSAPPEPDTAALMKKKLEYGQKLLESLTLNDLPAAGKQAEALIRLRQEAAFRAIKTPEYDFCADSFTSSAEGVVKAAKEANLEAAKLHYLGMTMACFNCHAYVRDQRKKG